MLRKVCRVCGSGMIHWPRHGEVDYYCEPCREFTEYDELDLVPHCPDCDTLIIPCASCGSQAYFCRSCRVAKSSRKVVWKPAPA